MSPGKRSGSTQIAGGLGHVFLADRLHAGGDILRQFAQLALAHLVLPQVLGDGLRALLNSVGGGGLLIFLLVMELSRLAHPMLFWINFVMIFYTLWGFLSPVDFFWHPGTSFYRVVTSSTVELSTGIYGIYGQLALTLIAAFLLLAAAANGFGAQAAMIAVMRRLAGRSLRPSTPR